MAVYLPLQHEDLVVLGGPHYIHPLDLKRLLRLDLRTVLYWEIPGRTEFLLSFSDLVDEGFALGEAHVGVAGFLEHAQVVLEVARPQEHVDRLQLPLLEARFEELVRLVLR